MSDTNPDWVDDLTKRVATAIRDLRGDRSAAALSDATADLGHRVTRAIIADLETGRRKYVAVHEVIMLSAALGVTPATLLTWGLIPDGEVELLPDRRVSGMDTVSWWGGIPLNPFLTAAQGLPRDNPSVAELLDASRERVRLRDVLSRSFIGGLTSFPDPALLPTLRERMDGVIARIRALGGVIRESNTSDGGVNVKLHTEGRGDDG
ncbi:hypothetical protein D2E77_01675 [Mycobacteroides abscessus]|nr:hypothetical protein D2E77_01675 [Mycobacteroides abscessus]